MVDMGGRGGNACKFAFGEQSIAFEHHMLLGKAQACLIAKPV